MQDIKNITENNRRGLKGILEWRRKPAKNTFRRIAPESPKRRRNLRVLLPVIACLLAAYPLFHLLVSAKNALSSVNRAASSSEPSERDLDFSSSFRLAYDALPSASLDGSRFRAQRPDGTTIVYAINGELQNRVMQVMQDYKVPYGVFVAIEPKTGNILAIASHSSVDAGWEGKAPFNLYPMASLFKIVTAATALELRKVTPETVLPFRGRLTSENPRYWQIGKHGNQEMDLTSAMGKSVNPLFGRLANDLVGRERMVAGMERFGFNQLLFPGASMPFCTGVSPADDDELMLMGAGLCREVKVSPLYVAMMMGGIANKGVMFQPQLAGEIMGRSGKLLFRGVPNPVRRLTTEETSIQLSKMMSKTVSEGTSRKVFRDRRGRPKLASVDIAAKTGSINGVDPPGHYSWFAAYAPIDNPQIALAALIVNGEKWRIKASLLGEQALEAFFK